MSAPKALDLSVVAEALSDMIDLADAWATSGPEGYTRRERQRRDKACRVLGQLYRHLAEAAPAAVAHPKIGSAS